MLITMGILSALLFVSLNPFKWIDNFKNDNIKSFLIAQSIRLAIGLLWSWIGIYFILIEESYSGFLIWWGIPLSVFITVDGWMLQNDYNNKNSKIFGNIQFYLGMIFCVSYLIMYTVYPAKTMIARYNFVKDFVTVQNSSIPKTDTNNIGILSAKTAKRNGSMALPEFGNSSLYDDGTYSKQIINNKTTWVSPVEFENVFKAWGDKKAPGFTLINSNNPNEQARTIKADYKYMPSAVFSNDLARHVHFKYPKNTIIDSWFQVDDNEKGYWIVAIGHKEFFRFFDVQDAIVIVDPYTGDMKDYAIADAPDWVDIVISGDIAEKYSNIYGGNSRGFWSRYFASVDQFKLTTWTWKTGENESSGDDAWSVVTYNGELFYTSDCENLNASNKSIIGYIMISAKTGKITYFNEVRGVNGKAFGENAIQLFKEKIGWIPAEPTIYNIFDQATWYSTIVDENGQIQKYVFGQVSNGKVAYGDTFDSAINAYKKLLSEDGTITAPSVTSESKQITGIVERIVVGQTTTILIKNSNKIFVVENSTNKYALFTNVGDEVEIYYNDTNDITVFAAKFLNKSLNK